MTGRLLALLLVGFTATISAQSGGLKIVVLEGEDGVNIIQQKTAVRPLVEVRDRNNLPVSGALVTFSIGGNAASFGGASTLTIATNAAGQAAVTGLTPSAAGAFQIQVSAAFQGQLATATIAQTNVLTAAQAAAATAAGSGGAGGSASGGAGGGTGGASGATGGAAGGGGLSATTIGIVGAAVGGGALVATQVADSEGDQKFEGTFSGTITGSLVGTNTTCNYTKAVSATGRLLFSSRSDSVVSGKFDYDGSETVTSSTCVGGTPTGPRFTGEVDLSGSPSSFGGRNTFAAPPTPSAFGGTITGAHVYTFQGSLTGDSATGVFTYEENSLSTGSGGNVTQLGTGSFTITFRKQ